MNLWNEAAVELNLYHQEIYNKIRGFSLGEVSKIAILPVYPSFLGYQVLKGQ